MDLAQQWKDSHQNSQIVLTGDELDAVDISTTDYLMGLMAEDHVQWHDMQTPGVDASLPQMVDKAVQVRNPIIFC